MLPEDVDLRSGQVSVRIRDQGDSLLVRGEAIEMSFDMPSILLAKSNPSRTFTGTVALDRAGPLGTRVERANVLMDITFLQDVGFVRLHLVDATQTGTCTLRFSSRLRFNL